jgi:hypothetical protein
MIKIDPNMGARISQGDIYHDVEYIESVGVEGDILVINKILYPYTIVLTQDCDLEQDYKFRIEDRLGDKIIPSVLVAPFYNADQFFLGTQLEELGIKMRAIQKMKKGRPTTEARLILNNEIPRYHYLDFPAESHLATSIIDFKHYFSLNTKYLVNIRTTNFVCKVSELYREKISQRFAAYLSRIGLPDNMEEG